MALTYIPGSNVTVTITAGDTTIGPTAATVDIDYGPAQLAKPLLGAAGQSAIGGQGTGTFSATGHGTEENLNDLAALWTPANQPFDVVVTYPDTSTTACSVVGSLTMTHAGDGEVDWSISGILDGQPVRTPAP